MGLSCIQNSSLLVYSKSQKVSASYCLPFQHSRGKNQPVGGFRPPPGLFRVKHKINATDKANNAKDQTVALIYDNCFCIPLDFASLAEESDF